MANTAISNLVNVRFYSPDDDYHYTTDNRPLTDLATNDAMLASLIDGIAGGNIFFLEDGSPTANDLTVTTSLLPNTGPYSDGQTVSIRVNTNNSGATTLTVNNGSPYPINGPAGALQGGELVAGGHYLLNWKNSSLTWELVGPGTGATQVGEATQSDHAIQLGQVQNSTLSVAFSGTTTGTLVVTGGATVPAASSNSQPVQLNQLFIGNRKEVFTASGSYQVPAFVTTLWVSGVAGGGGGGGGNMLATASQGAGGGGGWSGEPIIKQPIAVTPGHTLSVTLGAGGAGGAGAGVLQNAGNGAIGGNTVLVDSTSGTTLLTLSGGEAGLGADVYQSETVFGGAGWSNGWASWGLYMNSSGVLSASGNIAYGGPGGPSPFGSGGSGGSSPGLTQVPGGYGGRGAGGGGGGAQGAGGNGGSGVLIIEW